MASQESSCRNAGHVLSTIHCGDRPSGHELSAWQTSYRGKLHKATEAVGARSTEAHVAFDHEESLHAEIRSLYQKYDAKYHGLIAAEMHRTSVEVALSAIETALRTHKEDKLILSARGMTEEHKQDFMRALEVGRAILGQGSQPGLHAFGGVSGPQFQTLPDAVAIPRLMDIPR